MAEKVQVRYEALAQIAQSFAEQADRSGDLRIRLLRQLDVLQSGGWIGEGATKFFDEMERLIFPALDRLERALNGASGVVKQASDLFADAEQDAAARFRADGGGLVGGGAGGTSGGSGSGGSGTGGAGSGGLSDNNALRGAAKFVAGQIIKSPTLISTLARTFAGGGAANAVDDLVSLGRKLRIEAGLATGARFVAGGVGGLIDFAFLPSDLQTAESFGVQVTSGLIQGAVTLNPIGAGVMIGNGVVQVGGSIVAWGGEKIGEIFDVDTSGFVDGVNAVKDTLNVDKHVDTVVQGVVDGAEAVIDFLF